MDVGVIVETTFENGTKRSQRLDGLSRPARIGYWTLRDRPQMVIVIVR